MGGPEANQAHGVAPCDLGLWLPHVESDVAANLVALAVATARRPRTVRPHHPHPRVDGLVGLETVQRAEEAAGLAANRQHVAPFVLACPSSHREEG